MKLTIMSLSTTLLLAATGLHAPAASAAVTAASAAGLCQSALPVFAVQIRSRPLAVGNEGTSNAFITCAVPHGFNPDVISDAVVFLTNRTAAALDVSCTFVDGVSGVGVPVFHPKTISVPVNVATPLVWTPAEFGLTTFGPFQSFSCNLQPGVEINVVGYDYTSSVT